MTDVRVTSSPDDRSGPAGATHRIATWGRPAEAVPGLDEPRSLRLIIGMALAMWAIGFVAFVSILLRADVLTGWAIVAYAALGPVLCVGWFVAVRAVRMPGFLLVFVTLWTSTLGATSDFYYEVFPITTVALCTAWVAWMGTRFAPLYASATVIGLLAAGALQGDDSMLDRAVVVGLATTFAVAVVGRASDSARLAHRDREVLMARLAHESRHDELTGLGNRKLLIERATMAMASPVGSVAIAVVDLDDFKAINDTFGHLVGDEVLREVGARLAALVEAPDTVVRTGGDEFAALFAFGSVDVEAISRMLRSAFDRPVRVNGIDIAVAASVGVAQHPRASTSLEALLRAADDAMYAHKRA